MPRVLTAAVALLFLADSSTGQPPTFRAATRLVEVSVVVEDGSGRPVRDLTPADFTLYEDGKAQQIEIFAPPRGLAATAPIASATVATSPAATTSASTVLPWRDFSNRIGDNARGVTVVLIDRLNTAFEDQHNARAEVKHTGGALLQDGWRGDGA
jgi:VWFA-related protein